MGYRSLLLLSLQLVAVARGLAPSPQLAARQDTLTGDSTCGTLLCVSAVVNGSTTSYLLSGKNTKVGWMAIGFGTQMAGTPMVIMWMNSDGTATISQRTAPDEVMPTLDSDPPSEPSPSQQFSSSAPQLAFTIPSNSDTSQHLIYALGTTNPGSSAKDATLVQHLDYGLLPALDLTKPVAASTTGTSTAAGSTATSGTPTAVPETTIPLLPYQRTIIAHAIFCALGFLLFLPAGALLARYMRTFVPGPTWFKGHWILQFGVAGPTILIGVILGISSVNQAKAVHLNDDHKRWGIALFVLYLVQCALGVVIHLVKEKNRVRRPPQNYVHAVFGLLIMALALYQVHSGYDSEWPGTTGRDPVANGVNIFFWVWVILLAVAYGAGLSFLPKQYRQETQTSKRAYRNEDGDDRNQFGLRETSYRM